MYFAVLVNQTMSDDNAETNNKSADQILDEIFSTLGTVAAVPPLSQIVQQPTDSSITSLNQVENVSLPVDKPPGNYFLLIKCKKNG